MTTKPTGSWLHASLALALAVLGCACSSSRPVTGTGGSHAADTGSNNASGGTGTAAVSGSGGNAPSAASGGHGGASGSVRDGGQIATGEPGRGGTGGASSGSGGMSGGNGGAGGGMGGIGGGGAAPGCSDCLTDCGGACVDVGNDIHNCGACGHVCPPEAPVCIGHCEPEPECIMGCRAGSCCRDSCCGPGEICCYASAVAGGLFCRPATASGTCPTNGCPKSMCNSPDTPIATPDGERAIATLVPGDLVYSMNHAALAVVPIAQVHRVAAEHHHVVRLTLDNGAVLEISPGHPLPDGRTIGDLVPGSRIDQARVVRSERVPYQHSHTYDILPASDSGSYVAGGVLIGSTLH